MMKNIDEGKGVDPPIMIVANLKWGKTLYDSKISILPGSLGRDLKLQIQSITDVPISRQKLLCPKYWKGVLKDNDHLNLPPATATIKTGNHHTSRSGTKSNIKEEGGNKTKNKKKGGNAKVTITLIGSRDMLVEKSIDDRPRFVEDMNPEELRMAQRGHDSNDGDDKNRSGCVGDIIALQLEKGVDRFHDENKMGMYQYNRLVTGLPQNQIEDKLAIRQKLISDGNADKNNGHDGNDGDSNKNGVSDSSSTSSPNLLGEVVMTMGMELRRAYVNSLTVLKNGTLVSGFDDGHIQLWRRGEMVKDIQHPAGGVDHVMALPSSCVSSSSNSNGVIRDQTLAFAAAGNGNISIWTGGGDQLASVNLLPGTTTASLATGSLGGSVGNMIYLASCNRVTRQVDPNQFRLVPQDEVGRRRREAAEEQERLIQERLTAATQCINVWFYNTAGASARDTSTADVNQSTNGAIGFVSNDSISLNGENAASITHLSNLNGKLVCGDEWGGIRIFEWGTRLSSSTTSDNVVHNSTGPRSFSRHQSTSVQFQCSSEPYHFGISCMEPILEYDGRNMLAVSIYAVSNSALNEVLRPSALPLHVPVNINQCGVCIVDIDNATIKAVLNGHSDIVQCICPLPDGGILTAGGKMDATICIWKASTTTKILESDKTGESGNDDGVDDAPVIISESVKLKEPGYVFDLKVLPDSEPDSNVYAIAAARYNVVKIVI